MSKAKVTFPSAPDTSAIDIEDEGSLIVSNPTAMNFTGPGVTVTENPTGTAEVDIPGLQYWTESEDAAVQQSTIFTPNNAAPNVNAVIQPKGNGANTAQTPDGTTAGGNARGAYATDWQKVRNSNSRVASGNESTISGGALNTASGTRSTVIGGSSCNATGVNSVAGSDQATASGIVSICIGSESLASGQQSTSIGRKTRATASNSRAETGSNQAEAVYANASGGGAKNRNAYSSVFAAAIQASGHAHISSYSGRTQEGIAILGYNSRVAGGSNPPQLQASGSTFYLANGSGITNSQGWQAAKDNQFFTFQIKLLATVTAITGTATGVNVGDVKQWNFEGSGKIVSGTLTILNAGTTDVVIYEDSGLASMSAQFVASGTLTQIEITNATFAGGGELELLVNGFLYFQETSLD